MTSLYFWDAKRPITKKLLQRVDLRAILDRFPEQELIESAGQLARDAGISIGEVELKQAIAQLADDWIPDNVLELSD